MKSVSLHVSAIVLALAFGAIAIVPASAGEPAAGERAKADERLGAAEKAVGKAEQRLQNAEKTADTARRQVREAEWEEPVRDSKVRVRKDQLKAAEEAAATAKAALKTAKEARDNARAEAERVRAGKTGDGVPGAPPPVTPADLLLKVAEALHDGRNALDDIQKALKKCDRALFDAARARMQSALKKLAHVADLGLLGPRNARLQGVGSAAHSYLNEIASRWKTLEALWEKNCGGTAMCAPPPTGTTVAAGPPVPGAPPGPPPPPGGTTGQDQPPPGDEGTTPQAGGPADGETPERLVSDDTVKELVKNAASQTNPDASRKANQDLADFMTHAFQAEDTEALRSLVNAMDSTTPSGDQKQWSSIKRAVIDLIGILDSPDRAAAARAYAQRQAIRQQAQTLPSNFAGAHLVPITREALVLLPAAYQTRLLETQYKMCSVSRHESKQGVTGPGQITSQEQFVAAMESIESEIDAITQQIKEYEPISVMRQTPSPHLDSLKQARDELTKQRDELFKHVSGVQTDEQARAQFIKDLCDAAKRIKRLEEHLQQAKDNLRDNADAGSLWESRPIDEGRPVTGAERIRRQNYIYLYEEVQNASRALENARERENRLLQTQVNVGDGSGPQTLEEVLKKYCGGTNQALIDDTIDQALRQVKESIADHYVKFRQRTGMDQVIHTFGDPVLRPFLLDWAKSLKQSGIYDPALVDAMVQGVVGAYEHGKAQGEFRDRAVDFGVFVAQGALAIAMVALPPTAVVLGPASIVLGGASIGMEAHRSAELGQQVAFGQDAVKAGTGDPEALRHRQQEKAAQDLTLALTAILEPIATIASAADIVRGIRWKGPYFEGITRGATTTAAGQAGSEATRVGAETPAPSGAPVIAGGGPRAPPTPTTPLEPLHFDPPRATQPVAPPHPPTVPASQPVAPPRPQSPTEPPAGSASAQAGSAASDTPTVAGAINPWDRLAQAKQADHRRNVAQGLVGTRVSIDGEVHELGNYVAGGTSAHVFEVKGQPRNVGKVFPDRKIGDEVLDPIKGMEDGDALLSKLPAEDRIDFPKILGRGTTPDGRPAFLVERLRPDAYTVLRGQRLTPEQQSAVTELHRTLDRNGLDWWDGHIDNVYFYQEGDKLRAGILDTDRIIRKAEVSMTHPVVDATTLGIGKEILSGKATWTKGAVDKLLDHLGTPADVKDVQAVRWGHVNVDPVTGRFVDGTWTVENWAKANPEGFIARQAVAGSGAPEVARGAGGARALTSAAQAGTGSGSAQTAAQIARSATYVLRFASTSVGPYAFITAHAPLCFSYVGDPVVVPGEAGDGYGYLVPVGTNDPGSFGDALSNGGQQFVYFEKIKIFDAQLMAEGAGAPLRETPELVAH